MLLTLIRHTFNKECTIGTLYVDGVLFCNTLEDCSNTTYYKMSEKLIKEAKIKGATSIPAGCYIIDLGTVSPKFKDRQAYKNINGKLPRLLNVPAFNGILIHIGNSDKDTEGCILVGDVIGKNSVLQSTAAFNRLYEVLREAADRGEEIKIAIV